VRGGRLVVALDQCSEADRKPDNDDFHGASVPDGPALASKGIAIAIADGIGSSRVSGVAASLAVRAVVDDYYCTPESWAVKTAGGRVIAAVNSWLHAETRRGAAEPDQGYVCTLSALILKGMVGHVFHAGDSRVWRSAGRSLEQLTEDHRVHASSEQSYLARAIGAAAHVDIDYRSVALAVGDVFVLSTDGVHDHLAPEAIVAEMEGPGGLDAAAQRIVARALAAGSSDNLTVQLVRIESVPEPGLDSLRDPASPVPCQAAGGGGDSGRLFGSASAA